MGLFVNSFQLLESRVRVNLRRLQALMAQQASHAFKPCVVVEHRRGKAVPQHVG